MVRADSAVAVPLDSGGMKRKAFPSSDEEAGRSAVKVSRASEAVHEPVHGVAPDPAVVSSHLAACAAWAALHGEPVDQPRGADTVGASATDREVLAEQEAEMREKRETTAVPAHKSVNSATALWPMGSALILPPLPPPLQPGGGGRELSDATATPTT